MTTVADAVAETRRRFFSEYRTNVNILTTTMDASTTSVEVDDPLGTLQPGRNISIGLEVMRVRAVSGQVATVLRGWDGSSAAAHTAGDVVWVDPAITDFDIFREICNDLHDLSSPDNGLFAIETVEFNYNPTQQGYPMAVDPIIGVIDVRYREPGPWKSWPSITKWRFDQSTNTDDFAGGNSLVIYESGYPGQKIHVVCMVPFTTPTTLADDLQTVVGLPASANDLPALGAAIRLNAGREIQRNFTQAQGQPRRADEVPPGSIAASSRMLQGLRMQRVITEANRLKMTYPTYRKH